MAGNKRLKTDSLDDNSRWATLSPFIVEEIMLYLELSEILESALVCSHWYSVVQDKTFWKKLLKVYLEDNGNEDSLDDIEVLDPYLLYKRLYKMEHAKERAQIGSVSHSEYIYDDDIVTGLQFSNSGEYVFTSSRHFIKLWRRNEDSGSIELLKKFQPPAAALGDYGRIVGYDNNFIHYYKLFNDSDDCILIMYQYPDRPKSHLVDFMVYSIPDCTLLKKVEVDKEYYKGMKSVCWFGRCTFLVEYILSDAAVFTLYSVNEGFEPHTIYTLPHYSDESIAGYEMIDKMTVLNDNDKNEKIIVFFTVKLHHENDEKYARFENLPCELHILRARELFGPNTSSCLTERKFSSPDPKHYSCSASLTKTVDFEVRQFSDRFPGKIAIVCIPDISKIRTYTEIRLYDFDLNLLHTFPVRGCVIQPGFCQPCEYMFYYDQRSILTFNDMTPIKIPKGTIKYFDVKHNVGVDIKTGHWGSIRSAAFSPTNPNILCSIAIDDGLVRFYDFSV